MFSPSYSFIGGDRGQWKVAKMLCLAGEKMEATPFFDVRNEYVMNLPVDFRWLLRGVSGTHGERDSRLQGNSMLPMPQLGRKKATCAAFIALKRTEEWWNKPDYGNTSLSWMTRDFYEKFPNVARQLHFSKVLGEPFDFLLWMEYLPEDTRRINTLLASFRASEEWQFVEREIEMSLVRRDDLPY